MINTTLYKQFLAALNQLNPEYSPMSVALSGGVDSVVLLHLCHALRQQQPSLELEAIYIDHGLSTDSVSWQQFCAQLCESLKIRFKTTRVAIEQKSRHSLEAQAREARYQALDALAKPASMIVLGQHGDDQLETFLLRLKRGSGLSGLSAMRARRVLNANRVCIRPLLSVSRQDIEAFAQQFALKNIEDGSNQDNRFDRNFLRNQVVPLLKNRFNGFLGSALRSIELLQQQQALIDEITQQDLKQCLHKYQCSIDIDSLSKFSSLRQANVVRAWLAQHQVEMPSKVQLEQLLHQALTSKEDAQLRMVFKGADVRGFRKQLFCVKEMPVRQAQNNVGLESLELEEGTQLTVVAGEGIQPPEPMQKISIRFGLLNEKIRPRNKPGRNTVKHWLKEAGVPSWQRNHIPLVFYDDTLVQIVGYFFEHTLYTRENGIKWELCSDE